MLGLLNSKFGLPVGCQVLREFLYVDVTRVRSLLAQLDGGVIDNAVNTRLNSSNSKFGAKVLGVSGDGGSDRSETWQESRSMQELSYVIFEEIAESNQVIRDLDPGDLGREGNWENSDVHNSLTEGEIVRVFTTVLIVDPTFVVERMRKFIHTNEAIAAFSSSSLEETIDALRDEFESEVEVQIAALSVPRDKKRAAEKAIRAKAKRLFDDAVEAATEEAAPTDNTSIENIAEFFNAYLGKEMIEVRFLAVGPEHPSCSFAGSLLGRDEYIQKEREALYSRYGCVLEGWTSVLQIARVPTEEAGIRARERDFGDLELTDDDVIRRSLVIQSAVHLTEMLEARGIAEGPLWPSISVIPLAIYRTIPRSAGIGQSELSFSGDSALA